MKMKRLKYLIPLLFILLLVFVLVLFFNNENQNAMGVSALLEETDLVDELTQPGASESFLIPTQTVAIEPQNTIAPTSISTQTTPTTKPEETWEDVLYHTSLRFIADTPEEADQVAREIDFLAGEKEVAGNMCGPLSIAILKDGGLLPEETDVHDAWLLCAHENRENCFGMETLTKSYFPPDEYEYKRVYENVKDYDFKSNPLQPGDWMYLYTYIHGYDHMLVVTRVDERGNPYTVTNVDWGEGFVIQEMKLYDVDNPEEGLFYELTKIERRRIGMMGTAGFLLVRKIGELGE